MNYTNYHTHSPMMFWIEKGADKQKDWAENWWSSLISPIESKLTREDISILSEAAALACIDNYISEVWDMYFFEEKVAKSFSKHKVKIYAGEAIMTNPPIGYKWEFALEETENLIKKFKANPLIVPVVGYIGPYSWASNKELTGKSAQLAIKYKVPVHTHGAGSIGDYENCKKLYGKTPIQVLEDFGFFSKEIPQIVIAHCAVLDKNEINILGKYKDRIKVAVCPHASRKLNYPNTPVKNLVKKGINVVLGTDGGSPSGIPDIRKEIILASKTYNLPESYFEEQNKNKHNTTPVNPDEREDIINKWRICLDNLAERAGLSGNIKKEFLSSKKLLN